MMRCLSILLTLSMIGVSGCGGDDDGAPGLEDLVQAPDGAVEDVLPEEQEDLMESEDGAVEDAIALDLPVLPEDGAVDDALAPDLPAPPDDATTQDLAALPEDGAAQDLAALPEDGAAQDLAVLPEDAAAQDLAVLPEDAAAQDLPVLPEDAAAQDLAVQEDLAADIPLAPLDIPAQEDVTPQDLVSLEDMAPDAPAIPYTVILQMYDFLLATAVEGATCELIHEDGTSYDPPLAVSSDVDGYCRIELPAQPEFYSAKITANRYVDHYVYRHYTLPQEGSHFWFTSFPLVNNATKIMVSQLLGITLDPSLGVLVGNVSWQTDEADDPNDFLGEPVGCATVTSDVETTIYYLNANSMPDPGLTSTDPEAGLFLQFNVPLESHAYEADAAGVVSGTEMGLFYPDSVTFGTIYYPESAYPTNPTPTPCP